MFIGKQHFKGITARQVLRYNIVVLFILEHLVYFNDVGMVLYG